MTRFERNDMAPELVLREPQVPVNDSEWYHHVVQGVSDNGKQWRGKRWGSTGMCHPNCD